ncbi:MAG: ABC transporter substrate-binding protein [Proteobacteria bacterium]|nr:ABC transporter substrate-binding protein [Pseudomonadota bacterium]
MSKKIISTLAIITLIATISAGSLLAKTFRIGVTVIVSHPALQADQDGFEKALKDAGIMATYDYQNAQGDMSNAQVIAQKFKNDDLDLVHAIATPTAQAAVKVIKNTPVVYSSVTDPVGAGLVSTMGPSGTNVTGISDAWPIEMQIDMYRKFVPDAKTWGTIYNAGDANSVKSIGWTKEAMKKFGFELIEVTVSNSSEVYAAARSLAGRVDAIYITSDNIVVSAFESVVKVANNRDIPLFAGDTASVARGAVAAYGLSYFKVGYSAGKKAALVLKGQAPGDVPSGLTDDLSLHLSEKAAKAQKVSIPFKYIKMAEKIIE